MNITYVCERQYPNDIEKQAIKRVLIENRDMLIDGDGLILPHKRGVIFFKKKHEKIEIIDFAFSKKFININE